MPQTFMSGETTCAFDREVPESIKKKQHEFEYQLGMTVNSYQKDIGELRDSISEITDTLIPEEIGKLSNSISSLEADAERMNLLMNARYDGVIEISRAFLNSRLMRFLNFFGCWYIYADDGNIMTNIKEHQDFVEENHCGKIPFFTRVKRWLVKHLKT